MRGERWEQIRLAAFEGYCLPLDIPIAQVTAQQSTAMRITLYASGQKSSSIAWSNVHGHCAGKVDLRSPVSNAADVIA